MKLERVLIGKEPGMISEKVIEVYEKSIRQLSIADQLELLAMIARGLASDCSSAKPGLHDVMEFRGIATRDIMEMRGLGKEIWEGIDAQEYVNRLRDEWERPAT